MGQQSMDKPPTKEKPSAFDDEAKELDKRLRQLISDYTALFHRYPNAEGRPSVEVIEKAQVLAALRVHPWRKKLAAQASKLQRESLQEQGIAAGHNWYLRMWIDNIPEIVARCEWDVQSVARNLIAALPASLRVRCPRYPALIADSVQAAADNLNTAAAAVASKIRDEVKMAQRCDDLDAETIGRLALEAMGYEGARHLRLLRPQKD